MAQGARARRAAPVTSRLARRQPGARRITSPPRRWRVPCAPPASTTSTSRRRRPSSSTTARRCAASQRMRCVSRSTRPAGCRVPCTHRSRCTSRRLPGSRRMSRRSSRRRCRLVRVSAVRAGHRQRTTAGAADHPLLSARGRMDCGWRAASCSATRRWSISASSACCRGCSRRPTAGRTATAMRRLIATVSSSVRRSDCVYAAAGAGSVAGAALGPEPQRCRSPARLDRRSRCSSSR